MARKILVVDDDLAVGRTLRQFLEGKGYSVTEAHDGEQALEAYNQERPDVVLLNMHMPSTNGTNGLTVLREIRALNPIASVLMTTDVCDEETARQVLSEGAFDCITKPFSPDYLELALMAGTALSGGVGWFDSDPVWALEDLSGDWKVALETLAESKFGQWTN